MLLPLRDFFRNPDKVYYQLSPDGEYIAYLAPYADPASNWPHQQINELASARRELAYVLRRAALAYHAPKYEELLNKHLASEFAQQRWQLLWPPQ